jgi:RimJ/RimL family protein N-acetyltransferase
MTLNVRPMQLAETGLIIDYFHGATAEHLEMLGADPTRLPTRTQWRQIYEQDFALPIEQRRTFQVIWELDGAPIGFSTTDKITFGQQANMHLHIVKPELRLGGNGTECVRSSVDIYFEMLRLKRLFSEPNAFNVAPNRTLQKVGFRYVKTHNTVPGWLNYHQAVTRWVIERD